jgi:phosphopantothenoylcysteine decarboxylase/phosphopantothenate--cysteine ligase
MLNDKKRPAKILFLLTGSIACFKACQVVSQLIKAGHEIEIAASTSALKFVGEATLEGLTSRPIHKDTFESGKYMAHIHLMRWADIIVLAPATANTINKMAGGIGDDLVTTLFLAHDFKKSFLVAPAMNTQMYKHPATQSSLAKLQQWGLTILDSPVGNLACGESGEGRLLAPELITEAIETHLASTVLATTEASTDSKHNQTSLNGEMKSQSGPNPQSSPKLNILITAGGSREPLDGVRAITNFSSGRTAAQIADYFISKHHFITYLHASGAALPLGGCTKESFLSFKDLDQSLTQLLRQKNFDAVIHLAAVSDYSVASINSDTAAETSATMVDGIRTGKIDSESGLIVHLQRNPKLIDKLRDISLNKNLMVVAFKLTNTFDTQTRGEAVTKLALHALPDWIVHNDLKEISSDGNAHTSTLYQVNRQNNSKLPPIEPSTKEIAQFYCKTDLAKALEQKLCLAYEKKETPL